MLRRWKVNAQEMTAACTATTKGKASSRLWPCIRAAGHDGSHKPSIEADHYTYPLTEFDHAWLASEIRLLLAQRHRLQHELWETQAAHRDTQVKARTWQARARQLAGVLRSMKHPPKGRTHADKDVVTWALTDPAANTEQPWNDSL